MYFVENEERSGGRGPARRMSRPSFCSGLAVSPALEQIATSCEPCTSGLYYPPMIRRGMLLSACERAELLAQRFSWTHAPSLILLHSFAVFMYHRKVPLRIGMSLLGSFSEPLRRFSSVFCQTYAFSIIHRKAVLRIGISGFCPCNFLFSGL